MPARKRAHEEMELSSAPAVPPLLKKLRNMWEFANLAQYIWIFGEAVKIDKDLDIEDLEEECLRPGTRHKLAEIGLCLLKNVSSHRGLTPEIFDEYTRRQYQAKKPTRNPFGNEEVAKSFHDLNVEEQIRVLVDLSQWTLINTNNIREKLEATTEREQANDWRINPIGWDREERIYFCLDDNRLYRRTEPRIEEEVVTPEPPPNPRGRAGRPRKNAATPKPKSTPTRGTRASKRLKLDHDDDLEMRDRDIEDEEEEEEEESKIVEDTKPDNEANRSAIETDGFFWECVAITLEEYNEFLATIQKSRDPNEKALYKLIVADVVPHIEAAEEKRRQKALRRQREIEAVQKLATAKRSSRIAGRRQHEIEEAEIKAAEEKRQQEIRDAQALLRRDQQMEEDRESRRLTREQRIKERELRRVIEEEALNNLTAEVQSEHSDAEGRKSKRQLKAEIERKRKTVEELQEPEEWVFDCSGCGMHGANLDDGSHSVACDKCNVWQHSKCLGITVADAEKDDFSFICKDCLKKIEEAKNPKPPRIKLKMGQSSSPPSATKAQKEYTNGSTAIGEWKNTFADVQPPRYGNSPERFISFKPDRYYTNSTAAGPATSGHVNGALPNGPGLPPIGHFPSYQAPKPVAMPTNGVAPVSNGITSISQVGSPATNGLSDTQPSKINGRIHGSTPIYQTSGPSLPQKTLPAQDGDSIPGYSSAELAGVPTGVISNGQPQLPGITKTVSATNGARRDASPAQAQVFPAIPLDSLLNHETSSTSSGQKDVATIANS